MRTTIPTKGISLFLCLMFSQGAWAVVFNVTTAEEFQAALTTAASNGADDEIVIAAKSLTGNFVFRTNEAQKLTISGNQEALVLLSQGYLDFVSLVPGLLIELSRLRLDSFVVRVPRSTLKQVTLREMLIESGNSNFKADELNVISSEVLQANLLVEWPSKVETLSITDSRFEAPIDVRPTKVEIVNSELSDRNHSFYANYDVNAEFVVRGSVLGSASLIGFTTIRILNNQYLGNIRMGGDGNQLTQIIGNKCDPEHGGVLWGDKRKAVEFTSNEGCTLSLRQNFDVFAANNVSPAIIVSGLNIHSKWDFVNNTLGQLDLTMERGDLSVVNNIVWRSDLTGLISLTGYPDSAVLKHNIIQAKEGYWVLDSQNISSDPLFYSEEQYDFHLGLDSPALDAGTNEAVTDPDATDLDGNPRILNGTVDIGAYERNTAPLHPADTNEDSIITLDEFNAYNTAWRANDTWPTPPNEIPIDYVTRAGYLLQKGGEYKNIGVGKPLTWVPVSE